MADDSLKQPVSITAINIMAQSLPAGFSLTYRNYVLSQSTDITKVANKANEAGDGAWDAQVKNDEQDVTLEEHETRLNAAEAQLINHENRITASEVRIEEHETRIATVEGNIATLQDKVTTIDANYISKAVSTNQYLQASGGSLLVGYIPAPSLDKLQVEGSVNVTASFKVNGEQVLGARLTGWTVSTGSANKGEFNADQAFNVSETYSQAEVKAIANGLIAARKRIKALEDVLRTHGLIA